ncbi:hypothetical protein J4E93_010162 [Alternaria ventricosa]|uniref:uncharacterized protein n=1 Tax=Alternaria ventricosa TaxID=1187951 RepID=UPI0020C1F303|nr:uncharacterized protein J4E93_010162 [Alternaria ventricosa]KAI4638362.1 hypothetical protein J4E93_010162 [Alternaria ventricosa]
MVLTNQQLLDLHNKAGHLLKHKLSKLKIPSRVFPSGRLPTLRDIYENPDSLIVPTIPPNLQLDFVFANYNDFAAANFLARKNDQDIKVCMATWHWQISQTQSFSSWHKEVRFNVLLAHIVLNTPNARKFLAEKLIVFLEQFVGAWLETAMHIEYDGKEKRDYWIARLWRTSQYDLVHWGKQARGRMGAAVKALEACVPPQEYATDDFWSVARQMPVEEYQKHGSAWAMQFIIYKEKKEKVVAKDLQNEHAQDQFSKGNFSGFSNLSIDETVPSYLSEELFNQPLVKALLVDVRNMQVQMPEKFAGWMDPQKAIELIQDKMEGLEDVTEQIKNMSFLKP